MNKSEPLFNVHHIVPKSKGGSDHKDNLVILPTERHKRLHAFFDEKGMREKIMMLLEIERTALQDDALEKIYNTLEEIGDNMYKKTCFKTNLKRGKMIEPLIPVKKGV